MLLREANMLKLFFLVSSLFFSTHLYANGLFDRAFEQYSKRDYTVEGMLSADNARYNFNQVLTKLMNSDGEYARVRNLQASHFLMQAGFKNTKNIFSESVGQAARGFFYFQKNFGNNPFKNNKMSVREKKIFADLLFWYSEISLFGIENLGERSAGWKKIVSDMQMLVSLGYGCMNDGGPYRILGKKQDPDVNFKKAFECTTTTTEGPNWNGLNILNYASVLWSAGDKDNAVRILKKFISHPAELLAMDFIPENRRAQKRASEKLKSWGFFRLSKFVAGEFVVKLKKGFNPPQLLNDFEIKERLSDDILVVKTISEKTMSNGLLALQKISQFEIVEPNYIFHMTRTPNDPQLAKTWGLQNIGQTDSKGRKGLPGVDVGADKAWDITIGNRDIVVAVIDTGIDFSSPDLKENAWVNDAELHGQVGVDDDGNGYVDDINGYDFLNNTGKIIDDHGHGTHIAGVIGARGDDGMGIAGINWNVRIMALKFLSANGGGDLASALKAIRYATRMKAQVTNNSWGGGDKSELLKQAIQEASDAGVLFVAASGNSGENADVLPEFPAAFNLPNMISVAAINNRGQLSNFSNFGSNSVHIGAPGENIYSTLPNSEYDSWSGTSMAAPFVTGAVALLWGNEPQLTMKEVKERLMKTATPLASLRKRTIAGGMVDLFAALNNSAPKTDPNDPAKWKNESWSVATDHPYKNNFRKDYVFKIPDANAIAVHFSRFQLEPGYDLVYFTDSENQLLGVWSGNHIDEFSPVAEGDAIFMRFVTDSLTTDYGYDIDKVMYR